MARKKRRIVHDADVARKRACVDGEEDVKSGGCLVYAVQEMDFIPPNYGLEGIKKLFDDRIPEVHVLFNKARRQLRKVCSF